MKKKLFAVLITVLMLGTLVVSCPDNSGNSSSSGNGGASGGEQAASPRIVINPSRFFNNDPISVTLSSTTPDATIYYTLDGSAPTENSPLSIPSGSSFNIEFSHSEATPNPLFRGSVTLRAIAAKEGYTNSTAVRHEFQVFPTEPPFGDGSFTGTVEGTDNTGYYSSQGGVIYVELELENGVIVDSTIEDGWQGTHSESEEYWERAHAHATAFFLRMNHWDMDGRLAGTNVPGVGIVDVLSYPTASIGAISKAARRALATEGLAPPLD